MMHKAMMAKRGRYQLEARADDIHADFEDGGTSLDNSNKYTLATKSADQNGPGLPGSVNTSPPTYKSVRESFSTPSHHTPREQQLGQSPKSFELPRRYHAKSPEAMEISALEYEDGDLDTSKAKRPSSEVPETPHKIPVAYNNTTNHSLASPELGVPEFPPSLPRPISPPNVLDFTSPQPNTVVNESSPSHSNRTTESPCPATHQPLRVNEPHPQSAYHPHQHQCMLNKRMRPASYR